MRPTLFSILILFISLTLVPATPLFGADPVDTLTSPARLEEMAKTAVSASDHATVARQYRLRAEALEDKAKKHEKEAQRLEERPRPAIEHKWPAFSRQPWVEERKQAMQARRAAWEARELASHHSVLSVEALALAKSTSDSDSTSSN